VSDPDRRDRRARRGGDARDRLSRPRVPGESTDPIAIGDAAALVGAQLGLAEPLVLARVLEGWADLVGPVVAEHSRVRAVRNGVLEVAVDSPPWASEFRYLEADLVERVSRLVGEGIVRGVRATVERPASPGADPR